jgi:hypothetical protein
MLVSKLYHANALRMLINQQACHNQKLTNFLVFVLAAESDTTAIQGLGDKKLIKDESGERTERVGAGGWGGGVHLANSDKETQDVNRVNLERFFRKQRRLKEKRDREASKLKEEREGTGGTSS